MLQVRGLSLGNLFELLFHASQRVDSPRHVFICVADHWEPKWERLAPKLESERVTHWLNEYTRLAEPFADSRGRSPQHTFFYPQDEYEPEYVDAVAAVCRRGLGDVEVHLHHDDDTADGLREKLYQFTRTLHDEHGLLRKDSHGRIQYGFIHGNWALDNSRPDGRWCGVNNEISVLIETGCYADFTMPSAPNACQTSTINSIYYAIDDPHHPKSHDRGQAATVGVAPPINALLMIQGPLLLDWSSRKWGLLPRIENGDLTQLRPPTLARLQLWLKAAVGVVGCNNWIFIKLHTHGIQAHNMAMLLGEPMRRFHQLLGGFAAHHEWFHHYYVTANEMASLVHQAEAGRSLPAWTTSDKPGRTCCSLSH
jgi:hypothetical protein